MNNRWELPRVADLIDAIVRIASQSHQSAPVIRATQNTAEGDPSVMPGCTGADTTQEMKELADRIDFRLEEAEPNEGIDIAFTQEDWRKISEALHTASQSGEPVAWLDNEGKLSLSANVTREQFLAMFPSVPIGKPVIPMYTRPQSAEVREAEIIERCAKVAEAVSSYPWTAEANMRSEIAKAIRALASVSATDKDL